jgi:hypothetical protein
MTTIFAGIYADMLTLSDELAEWNDDIDDIRAYRATRLLTDVGDLGYIRSSMIKYITNKTNAYLKEVNNG